MTGHGDGDRCGGGASTARSTRRGGGHGQASPLNGQVLGAERDPAGRRGPLLHVRGQIGCAADSGRFAIPKALRASMGRPARRNDIHGELHRDANQTAGRPATRSRCPPTGARCPAVVVPGRHGRWSSRRSRPRPYRAADWGPPIITPNPITMGTGTAEVVVTKPATPLTGRSACPRRSKTFRRRPRCALEGTVPVDVDRTAGRRRIAPAAWTCRSTAPRSPSGRTSPSARASCSRKICPASTRPPVTNGRARVGVRAHVPHRRATDGRRSSSPMRSRRRRDRAHHDREVGEGEAAEPGYEYTVSYNTDPSGTRTAAGPSGR